MNNVAITRTIDAHLLSFLEKKKKEAMAWDFHLGSFIDVLIEHLKWGGKHIRSLLFYKAYMSGKNISQMRDIAKVAGIFELFQSFALIHDDIIDKEIVRRGRATVHEKYGVPTALLSGNLALMYSDEILLFILENNDFINRKLILELFQQYKQEVMLGQYLDSHHTESMKTIIHLKTSQYTFIKPVIMGLLFAEEEGSIISSWENILEKLGMVFQLKDDYKNIFFSTQAQGKDNVSDIKEGKQTELIQLFLKKAGNKEITIFKTIFNKKILNENEKNWIIDTMIKLDIKKDSEQRITTICDEVLHDMSKNINENELTQYIDEVVSIIRI